MDFAQACAEAAMIPEFVENYNRIMGANFQIPKARSPIEQMVDKACGYSDINEEETRKFAAFFYEFVWSRLPDECFTENPPPLSGRGQSTATEKN